MKKHGLTWKMFVLILLCDVSESVGQLFMKKGVLQVGIDSITFANLQEFLGKSGLTPFVWLGVFFYALNFLLWIIVLSRVDLSVASPVGSAGYLFVPLLAIVFLGEDVGLLRWAGIILITGGVCLVAGSGGDANDR